MAARKQTRSQSSEAPSGPSTSSQTSSHPDQISMKSDWSKSEPPRFGLEDLDGSQTSSQTSSHPDQISVKSDRSKHQPPRFGLEDRERSPADEPHGKKCKTTFEQETDAEKVDGESKVSKAKQGLKRTMRQKNMAVFEGVGDQKSDLNSIYTQIFLTAGGSDAPRAEHESRQLRSALTNQLSHDIKVDLSDIFKGLPGHDKRPRTVLTKGVAGIGKSFAVQKFILDWASEESNLDVDFIFSLPFRELNLCQDGKSLHELVTEFHPDLRPLTSPADFVKAKTIVILDGLDESRLRLAFQGNEPVTSVHQKSSVANLVVNLIKGDLLPDANLWITSRPAAADQIPAEFVWLMTEIRGFTDPQIEEYFRRRFSPNLDLAERITSHIQSSPSLNHMCQIPIFCWISALLFQEVFGEEKPDVPQTLTEMMAHFLFAQTTRRKKQYSETSVKTKENFLTEHKRFLLSLGKLAFEQLLKNNLIFYQRDFEECGIDMRDPVVSSGFCNTVLLEEKLLYQKKVFFFVHLTIQEFFAALYVYDSFTTGKITELDQFLQLKDKEPTFLDLLKITVDKVLAKENGHMDFFMQFLLGLLAEPNRKVLRGLLKPPDSSLDTEKKILTHLKSIRRKTVSPDGCINLFQTMVEMRDHKVKDEIEEYLRGPGLQVLTPLHCSALAYSLQVSKSAVDELDLKRYKTSEEGRRRLVPAVRRSRRALLSFCGVTAQWVEHLAFGLKFPHSSLQDLDLSNNDLRDLGVQLLSSGLSSPYCRLEILRLSGCMVTEQGCGSLASALRSNPSHLKVLDLTYNHPGELGRNQLVELRTDPQIRLTDLKLDHGGPQRLRPGLRKYACDVTLDPNTVNKNLLQLSRGQRKVEWVEEQQQNTDRSECCLVQQSLPDRCYLELDLVEPCSLELAYQSVSRKQSQSLGGCGDESWSFVLADGRCAVEHGGRREEVVSPNRHSRRLGVFLDRQAGVLSFYRVSSESLTWLHTFSATFRDVLRAAVRLQPHASATFCPLDGQAGGDGGGGVT